MNAQTPFRIVYAAFIAIVFGAYLFGFCWWGWAELAAK